MGKACRQSSWNVACRTWSCRVKGTSCHVKNGKHETEQIDRLKDKWEQLIKGWE